MESEIRGIGASRRLVIYGPPPVDTPDCVIRQRARLEQGGEAVGRHDGDTQLFGLLELAGPGRVAHHQGEGLFRHAARGFAAARQMASSASSRVYPGTAPVTTTVRPARLWAGPSSPPRRPAGPAPSGPRRPGSSVLPRRPPAAARARPRLVGMARNSATLAAMTAADARRPRPARLRRRRHERVEGAEGHGPPPGPRSGPGGGSPARPAAGSAAGRSSAAMPATRLAAEMAAKRSSAVSCSTVSP